MNKEEKDIFKLLDNIAKDDVYKKSLKEELSTIPLGLTRKINVEYIESTETKGKKVAEATIQYFFSTDSQVLHREDGPAKIVYDQNENIREMFFYNNGKPRNTFSITLDENGSVQEKVMRKNSKWLAITYKDGEPVEEKSHNLKRTTMKVK